MLFHTVIPVGKDWKCPVPDFKHTLFDTNTNLAIIDFHYRLPLGKIFLFHINRDMFDVV